MVNKKSNKQAMADIFQGRTKQDSTTLRKMNASCQLANHKSSEAESSPDKPDCTQEKCFLCEGKGWIQLKKGGVVEVCRECLLAGRLDQ